MYYSNDIRSLNSNAASSCVILYAITPQQYSQQAKPVIFVPPVQQVHNLHPQGGIQQQQSPITFSQNPHNQIMYNTTLAAAPAYQSQNQSLHPTQCTYT